jgi:hypothetical protein
VISCINYFVICVSNVAAQLQICRRAAIARFPTNDCQPTVFLCMHCASHAATATQPLKMRAPTSLARWCQAKFSRSRQTSRGAIRKLHSIFSCIQSRQHIMYVRSAAQTFFSEPDLSYKADTHAIKNQSRWRTVRNDYLEAYFLRVCTTSR